MRPVSGEELGKLLHDTGVPVLALNACQSAMHEAAEKPAAAADAHAEVRAIGSLAQAVIDQGIPAVLGMRYSVFVVTAAQYIGQLYASLAKGRAVRRGGQRGAQAPGPQPRPLGGAGAAAAAGLVRAGGLRGDADRPAAGHGGRRRAWRSTGPSWTPSRPTPRCCATCPTPASSAATRRCCCSTGPSMPPRRAAARLRRAGQDRHRGRVRALVQPYRRPRPAAGRACSPRSRATPT